MVTPLLGKFFGHAEHSWVTSDHHGFQLRLNYNTGVSPSATTKETISTPLPLAELLHPLARWSCQTVFSQDQPSLPP